jgi:hypothetical protein
MGSTTGADTGDYSEVPVHECADEDGYDPDDYGGTPVFATEQIAQS